MVYVSVSVGGYFTCGNQCPEIIINRTPENGSQDLLMNFAKFALLVCLVVGIIIRNQSNKAGIFGIIDQFKKINVEPELTSGVNVSQGTITNTYAKVSTVVDDKGAPGSESQRLSEEIQRASSEVLKMEIEKTPASIMFIVQLFNCSIPAIVAVLVKDALINYVEAGSGFLAPVFIIIYPCKQSHLTIGIITIELHKKGILPVSPTFYIFIWFYLIIATTASYACLGLSFYYKYFGDSI